MRTAPISSRPDTVYPGIAPLGFSDSAFLISASVDGHTVYYRISQ